MAAARSDYQFGQRAVLRRLHACTPVRGWRLYTCLFAREGHDLRGPLRAGASDDELAALVAAVWSARDDRYSELRDSLRNNARERTEMYEIGVMAAKPPVPSKASG